MRLEKDLKNLYGHEYIGVSNPGIMNCSREFFKILTDEILERIEEISVKTEPIDDTAVEDVTGIAVYDDPSDHQVDVIPKEFTVIMTKSNVDNTSHGVYIPNNITPENREWTSNEDAMT
ncbi:hypothetical protein POM88_016158 [Heracleum sosnowskyi]|uniref:Uncharacterized protein n=1 Tax=Heracleum sosnowskyi TaxID=360622 RepID=A0AAD8ILM0_9APIA|nr:hypothetical protein POM88_016158 [Heracleum sosnowskyi]